MFDLLNEIKSINRNEFYRILQTEYLTPRCQFDVKIIIWSADQIFDLESLLTRSADEILYLEMEIWSASWIRFLLYFSFEIKEHLQNKYSLFLFKFKSQASIVYSLLYKINLKGGLYLPTSYGFRKKIWGSAMFIDLL